MIYDRFPSLITAKYIIGEWFSFVNKVCQNNQEQLCNIFSYPCWFIQPDCKQWFKRIRWISFQDCKGVYNMIVEHIIWVSLD